MARLVGPPRLPLVGNQSADRAPHTAPTDRGRPSVGSPLPRVPGHAGRDGSGHHVTRQSTCCTSVWKRSQVCQYARLEAWNRDHTRKPYPSDLREGEWVTLEPLVPAVKLGVPSASQPARNRQRHALCRARR